MFYDCFKEACAKHGVSMTSVVLKSGLSKGHLSAWKKGTTPTVVTATRVADTLGISVEELMGIKKEDTREGVLYKQLYDLLSQLPQEDVALVNAYVAGLLAKQ